MALKFKVEENQRNVHVIRGDKQKGNWEQWFLLSADHHWDNPKCDRALLTKHLKEAQQKDAGVFVFGDLFCAMQGKFDKRSSKSDIRPEHMHGNYLDRLVETAIDYYGPYAENIVVVSAGNHETSILNKHETNLTERLVQGINSKFKPKSKVFMGGYSGWIKFMFECKNDSARNLMYHHGYGGDSPVTKGTIQTQRMGVVYPDADIIVSGHTHNQFIFPITRLRLNTKGTTYHDEQMHIKVPTYKEEFQDGYSGWHIERGGPPKPTGAMWLKFYGNASDLFMEFTLAK